MSCFSLMWHKERAMNITSLVPVHCVTWTKQVQTRYNLNQEPRLSVTKKNVFRKYFVKEYLVIILRLQNQSFILTFKCKWGTNTKNTKYCGKMYTVIILTLDHPTHIIVVRKMSKSHLILHIMGNWHKQEKTNYL